MINRVVLENWRSHELTELEFSRGTNVLVGVMGSGKSSVMDAICYALFGTFPTLQSRRLRLDEVIMSKPRKKEKARVSVAFANGGKEYTVSREIIRGRGSTAELREGGRLLEGPNSQRVSERVEEMLKIGYDLFSRAVYSEQNNIDYFLEIPKSQRKQRIDELLSIDRFEAARRNLVTVIYRLKERAREKEKIEAPPDVGQVPVLKEEIAGLGKERAGAQSSISSLAESRRRLQSEYSAIAAERKKYEDLGRALEAARGKLAALGERLSRYGAVAESEASVRGRIEMLKKEKAEARAQAEEVSRMEREHASLSSRIRATEERTAELRSRKADEGAPARKSELASRMEALAAEIEASLAGRRAKEAALAELDENSQKLKGDYCPVCDAQLTAGKREELLKKKADERIRILKEVETLGKTAMEKATERNSLQPFLKEAENAAAEYQAIQAMLAEAEKLLAGMGRGREELGALSEKLESLRASRKDAEKTGDELRGAEQLIEYFSAKRELDACSSEVSRLEFSLSAVKYDGGKEKETYDSLKDAEKDYEKAEQEIRHIEGMLAEKGKRLAELERLKEIAEKSRAERDRALKAAESFEVLGNVLESAQAQLRSEFTETVNAALTDSWLKIYPYRDYSDLKLDVDESGDYTLKLKRRDGEWVGVEGITSGGERSCACLALRIALSLVLTQNLSWLVLDEPTHNIDRQGIRELARTLREHLPKIVEQIFIITHEEELESAASGYLYRFERKKEEDEPTRAILESAAV